MVDHVSTEERRTIRLKVRTATLDALRALGGEATRDDVIAHALANGGFTYRELLVSPPASKAAEHQRQVDYLLAWELTKLEHDGLVEEAHKGAWRLTPAALEPNALATSAPAVGARLAELKAMPYRDYLRTPEWRRTRAAALFRAGHACALDVSHDGELDVVHRSHERRGEELAADLVVLCSDCLAAQRATKAPTPLRPHIAPPEIGGPKLPGEDDYGVHNMNAALQQINAARPSRWPRFGRRHARTRVSGPAARG